MLIGGRHDVNFKDRRLVVRGRRKRDKNGVFALVRRKDGTLVRCGMHPQFHNACADWTLMVHVCQMNRCFWTESPLTTTRLACAAYPLQFLRVLPIGY